MGGDLDRYLAVGDEKRGTAPPGSRREPGTNLFSQSQNLARKVRGESARREVGIIQLALPQRSLDEWRRNGLVEARPDLPRLISLLKESYESTLRAGHVRRDFERLAEQAQTGGGRDVWDSLRDRVGELELELVADAAADPSLVERVREFGAELERGREQLEAVTELAGSSDPAPWPEIERQLRELRRTLNALQERSRAVGQACHERSCHLADALCRALDEVILVLPPSAQHQEAPVSHRDLPFEGKPAPERHPDETGDLSPHRRLSADELPAPRSRDRTEGRND